MATRNKFQIGGLIPLLIMAFIAAGCAGQLGGAANSAPVAQEERAATGGYDYDEAPEAGAPPAEPEYLDLAADGEAQQPIERLLIRTGSVSVSVEDTREAKENIEAMVNGMAAEGAFVVSVNEYGGSTDISPQISMQIRVPAARFDEAMDRIAGLAVEGTTPTQSESGQDVTEEYVDLSARLESLEAARQRLLEIMENSQSTEELLQAEAQLTAREAEIESIKGRMQYLQQSAALSSISIELQPYILSQPVDTRWSPAETVRRAVDALLDNLRDLADLGIYFGIACLPPLLIVGVIGYVLFRVVRTQMRNRRARINAGQSDANQP